MPKHQQPTPAAEADVLVDELSREALDLAFRMAQRMSHRPTEAPIEPTVITFQREAESH